MRSIQLSFLRYIVYRVFPSSCTACSIIKIILINLIIKDIHLRNPWKSPTEPQGPAQKSECRYSKPITTRRSSTDLTLLIMNLTFVKCENTAVNTKPHTTTCNLIETFRRFGVKCCFVLPGIVYPDDGKNTFRRKVCKLLPDHTISYPRSTSSSPHAFISQNMVIHLWSNSKWRPLKISFWGEEGAVRWRIRYGICFRGEKTLCWKFCIDFSTVTSCTL